MDDFFMKVGGVLCILIILFNLFQFIDWAISYNLEKIDWHCTIIANDKDNPICLQYTYSPGKKS